MANAPSYTEQIAQFGVENVFGVAQTPSHKFNRATLTVSPTIESEEIRASGSYFATSVFRTDDRSEGTLSGVPDFNELTPQLDLVFGTAAAVEGAASAVGSFTRVYTLSQDRPTWTVAFGTEDAAARAVAMFATGLTLDYGVNSKTARVEIPLAGGKFTDGATLNPSAATYDEALATALQVSVKQAATFAGLAAGNPVKALSTTFSLEGIARSEKYLDGQDGGISATVNQPPTATVELMVPKDADGTAWLAKVRSSETTYLRISVVGGEIADTGVNHSLTIDIPVKVRPHTRDDEDGAYVARPTLTMVEDTAGNALTVTLVNGVAGA